MALPETLKIITISFLLILMTSVKVLANDLIAEYPLLPSNYSSIRVFDQHSRFVGRLLPEKRYWVKLDRVPLFLQRAIIAVEDARFYEHGGVDLRGIARAAVKNVIKGRLAEGGSTITQQLIKNRYLSSEKTLDRKLNEGVLALEYEKKYTKQQILEMYLNEIYYGNGAWGIAQAALIYFDKRPDQLTEAEASFLAGIPKNPSRYNPLAKPEEATRRRGVVLQRMLDAGALSEQQYHQQLKRSAAPTPPNRADWYLDLVRSSLVELYGEGVLEQGGLEVTAALELPLQLKAEQIIRETVSKRSQELQGALVSIDPENGNLLAAAGGVKYVKDGFNRATQARRQPGSAIKPLIYATALEKGITAASLWLDSPVSYPRANGKLWQPQNFDGKHHGNITLRQALVSSNNTIAIRLLDAVGPPDYIDLANRNGLRLQNHDLSTALGSEEVTLSGLTSAYTPFATAGNRAEPRSIIRVFDRNSKTWFTNSPRISQTMTTGTSYIMTDMMKEVLTQGTAKGLRKFSQKYPSAGKTGTTNNYHDAWFIGYTPRLVTGIWVGYDKPRSGGKGFTGGAVAAPIWEQFMLSALAGQPASDFRRPDTVISVSIDPHNSLLATELCPDKREELFAIGTEPDDYCPEHQPSVQDEVLEMLEEQLLPELLPVVVPAETDDKSGEDAPQPE